MTTLTVIQARTGSTRLPGKVLADIGGKPLLQRVIERAQTADLGPLTVATTARAHDNAIADLCVMLGVDCYRSSERDVLNRFYRAAVHHQVIEQDDAIVRVTADCPLLCPELLTSTVMALDALAVDYVGVNGAPNGLGQESMTFGALEEAWAEAETQHDREHVITYIEDRPDDFQVRYVEAEDWMRSRAHWRLTVDDQDDLDLMRRLFDATGGELFALDSRAVLEAVEADAGMLALATRRP